MLGTSLANLLLHSPSMVRSDTNLLYFTPLSDVVVNVAVCVRPTVVYVAESIFNENPIHGATHIQIYPLFGSSKKVVIVVQLATTQIILRSVHDTRPPMLIKLSQHPIYSFCSWESAVRVSMFVILLFGTMCSCVKLVRFGRISKSTSIRCIYYSNRVE